MITSPSIPNDSCVWQLMSQPSPAVPTPPCGPPGGMPVVERSNKKMEEHIRRSRKALKPSPVRLHHVPSWLRRRLLEAYGARDRMTDGHSVLHHVAGSTGGSEWLDHWGSTLVDGQRVFVSEPYNLPPEAIEQIATIAKAIDCTWWISANSWWCPGYTIRVVIAPPREKKTGGGNRP